MGIVERVERHPRLTVASGMTLRIVTARPGPEYAAVLDLRRRVFGDEQGMTDGGVVDRDDKRSLHALVLRGEKGVWAPVGTGRLTLGYGERREGLIAWVAALPEAREQGVGSAVMRFLLAAADEARPPRVILAAQAHAQGFYRRFGFVPASEPYLVKGRLHRWMARTSATVGRRSSDDH